MKKKMHTIKRIRLLAGVMLLALAFATAATAQHKWPSSEIYLAEIVHDASGVKIGDPVQVTDHPDYYDNQPAFSFDGKSLYYVAASNHQTDIWVVDVATKKRQAYWLTPEPEFSPVSIPGDDDAIAVVRQDGMKYELWRYPADTEAKRTALLPDVDQAIHFAWSGDHIVFSRPPALLKAKVGAVGKGEVLAKPVGRTVKRVPGTNDVVFMDRVTSELKRVDATSGEIKTLIKALPERQDFAVGSDGTLWTSDGESIFMAAPGEKTWKKVTDLSRKIGNISRMDVNPAGTLLALVGDE
jgi:hypothetical protein